MGKTSGYGRLSRDNGDDESSSIFNQKRIITEFAKQHGINVDDFYIDDAPRVHNNNVNLALIIKIQKWISNIYYKKKILF